MDIFRRPWRRWVDFKGRATRREYWLFILQAIIGYFVIFFTTGLLAELFGDSDGLGIVAALVTLIYTFFVFVASLSAAVRRIHDHDKTGWLFLLTLVPLVGWIFYLIMMLTPGTKGENGYGYDPRAGDQPTTDELASVFT